MNNLKYADWNVVNALATKQVGKFSVYISNGLEYKTVEECAAWDFVQAEMTRLFGDKTPEFFEYISNVLHGGLFFFENYKEAHKFYHIFEQELTDSSTIYATLNCPDKGCLTENT